MVNTLGINQSDQFNIEINLKNETFFGFY